MRLPYEIWIGLRYMLGRRRSRFVSLITIISILGVTVGVTALVVVLSVMSGFERDLKGKILGMNAHVMVMKSGGGMDDYRAVMDTVKEHFHDDMQGITPFIYSQAMLTTQASVMGAVVRGIDANSVTSVTELGKYIQQGSLADLAPAKISEESQYYSGILIGKELRKTMAVNMGDIINVVSPSGSVGLFGAAPRMQPFRVAAIFDSGMFEYDSSMAFVSIDAAQKFFQMGDKVTGLEVKAKDVDKADNLSFMIQAELGFPFFTRDWKEMNRNLFGALQLEKFAMTVILVLIVMVAAFNIVSTLFMVVMEKGRDIAILKSMGATRVGVRRIFMVEGIIIGLVGAFLGTTGGLGLCYLLKRYQFIKLPSDIYYVDTLPVVVNPTEVALIAVSAVLISTIATLYPSWRASRLDPVEGIRYGAE